MIVELIISGASYLVFDYLEKREFKEYKKEFDSIIERLPALKNNQSEKPYLIAYDTEEYGYKIKFILPVGITRAHLQITHRVHA